MFLQSGNEKTTIQENKIKQKWCDKRSESSPELNTFGKGGHMKQEWPSASKEDYKTLGIYMR